MPKISIVIPIHDMSGGGYFLWRLINSIESQTFRDYEIIITKKGKFAENTNAGIKRARGELVKLLLLDDYLAHPNALQAIVDNFKHNDRWLVTGCLHQNETETPHSPHFPKYTEDIHTGNNCIGSPSVLTFRREGCVYFDEKLTWLPDCDLYRQYYDLYGPPKVVTDMNVVIGLGPHQATHTLSQEQKDSEHAYLFGKYFPIDS